MTYDFQTIEPKWQKIWEEQNLYATVNGSEKEKFYALFEFPYPSGAGLHVGHCRPYTAMDIIARKKRMEGKNVLFPIGYDAFGLPTENYAIKNHIHPRIVTEQNIATFRRQLKALGYSFDWDREINTTDPKYFKWTQWIFLQMFRHGLAYKAKMPVNWCTSCKCVLANEEVVEGVCERCGAPVVRKEKSQWMLRITKYADRLIDDLDGLDYIERVKLQQKNWIGRSHGAEVTFRSTLGDDILIYTTRPDTLFGATYMVLSPEHALLEKWMDRLENAGEVQAYQAAAAEDEKFYSMHLDVEPHQHPDFKTGEEGRAKVMQLFADFTLKKAAPAAKAAGTLLEWDIPFWMTDVVKDGEGKDVVLAELMAKTCDTIAIMSYRDTAAKILDVAKEEIAFAKQYGHKVILGVETKSSEGDQVSFMEEGKAVMVEEMAKVHASLKESIPDGNFGLAVHQASVWYSLKD